MQIRPAIPQDLPEIQSIYAHHVLNGTGTFDERPPSVEEMQDRHRRITAHDWAWLVATDETGVLGYAFYSQMRDSPAYRYTAEDRIYVREDVRGQGVGKELVARLIEAAKQAGFRQMLALIGDSDNVASIGMHASLGFTRTGVLRAAGVKFGRTLDVVIMQRRLDGDEADDERSDAAHNL